MKYVFIRNEQKHKQAGSASDFSVKYLISGEVSEKS